MPPVLQPAASLSATVEELDGSPTENHDKGRFSAQRKFKLPWSSRNTFCAEVLGKWNRLPQNYPGRARSVEIAPFTEVITGGGTIGTVATYEFAEATVHYADPEPGTGEDPESLASERLEPSAELLTIPNDNLRWDSATQVLNASGAVLSGERLKDGESPGVLLFSVDWVLTLHRVPFVSTATLDLVKHVNAATITALTLGISFEPETLLYQGCSLQREIFAEGPAAWQVELRFSYRPNGWNKFWRPLATRTADSALGDWTTVWDRVSGKQVKPYPSGNFLAILG